MTPERWQQIDKLLEQALELQLDRRESFLDEFCAGDEELRRELKSLLAYAYDARVQKLLERPAMEMMAEKLASAPSLAGEHVGPFKILSLVGAGGMGEVYKARDTRLNRMVSIKVLQHHLLERIDLRNRFALEATASALNHPNIVTVHDIIT